MKKLTALFLMAVLTVALASAMGCGKKAEESSTGAGGTNATSATQPAPAESSATAPTGGAADTTMKK